MGASTWGNTAFVRPGKPVENALIESFNDRLWEECLNQAVFHSLGNAREEIEHWRQDYNHHRSHSALNYLTQAEFWELHQPQNCQTANLALVY